MNRFFATLTILIAIFVAVGCYVGWITFHKAPDKATIEIKTKQIEQAGEKAVEAGRELVGKAADSVKKTVQDGRSETTTVEQRDDGTSSRPPSTRLK
jgi:hypothetical protein